MKRFFTRASLKRFLYIFIVVLVVIAFVFTSFPGIIN